ncbi:hypothetical protein F5051DRAFT_414682 [Lentinula edodes]|nr:hypothetical protein F5051DRAFT_414682 [Lentinula edodes]
MKLLSFWNFVCCTITARYLGNNLTRRTWFLLNPRTYWMLAADMLTRYSVRDKVETLRRTSKGGARCGCDTCPVVGRPMPSRAYKGTALYNALRYDQCHVETFKVVFERFRRLLDLKS